MKLVFPGGEHAPVDLAEGTTIIGTDAGCDIVVGGAGIAPRHCEIGLTAGVAVVHALDSAPTVLNGRQIEGETAVKEGDLLLFGRVGCQVNASDRKAATPEPSARAAPEDDGRTRVRSALPRFLLRGVSGATFGKTFAVTDNAVIGRQPDCDIPVPAEEVSRNHARLKVTPDGVRVEDMGSANGTYINGKRVESGLLKPGEELRLDTVRFLLVTPGMDAKQQSAGARVEPPPPAATDKGSSPTLWIVIGVVAVALVAFAVLHSMGKI
ncbi:MAG: FHA domain-containing protein [Dokdonella sp.]|uniref:FHA domain-containing protein n=1 Tax=Dokdonella sp. TaxID=2291710 RepID=UPI003266B81C